MTDFTSHPRWRAFVRSIREQPEDDLRRKACSDWLDDLDTEESRARAEFIRVQVELGRMRAECSEWARAGGRGKPPMWDDAKGRWFIDRELELLPVDVANTFAAAADDTTRDKPVRKEAVQKVRRGTYPWVEIEYRLGFVRRVRAPLGVLIGGERCVRCRGRSWITHPESGMGTHCPDCHRTGRTPGILRDLLRVEPVTGVEVTGVQPWRDDNGEWFWPTNDVIPREIWFMTQICTGTPGRRTANHFPTRELALAALNRAVFDYCLEPVEVSR